MPGSWCEVCYEMVVAERGERRLAASDDDRALGEPCPLGCTLCQCAAPDTPVDTPDGPRAIETIAEGDLVFSVEDGQHVVARVVRVNRTEVPPEHAMVRVTFDDGSAIELSPGHPTADGRTFEDLATGDVLGARPVAAVELVPYDGTYTVDILPATGSGTYFAAGALVGSTLSTPSRALVRRRAKRGCWP